MIKLLALSLNTKPNTTMKNIQDLLFSDTFLKINNKVNQIEQLQQLLSTIIESKLDNTYRVTNLRGNILIIETKNASIRMALLFKQQLILQTMQKINPKIEEIKIKVSPNFQ